MPVILTKKYTNRIGRIRTEVSERLANNDSHTFIYIAPTKRKIRHLQREFLKVTPGKIAPAFNLFTLETLAAQIYMLLCPPRQLISGPEQAVLIDEAITSVSQQLQYFRLRGSPKRLTKGTLLRIINVINVLKEKGVYLTALRAEADTVEKYERPKLNDILLIYEKYEELLGDRFADSGGLFKHVNEQWDPRISAEAFMSQFNRINTVFVSGFDEFANPELTMLNNISNVDGIGMVISFY
jgi:ATP-dependent helicase/DNAse subunit B